jgi:hypothetical protein
MNKYIIPIQEALNISPSIGRGSVLLIKGKPTPDGRRLYVTTIKGWVEIKPGIKMVFVGDTIYRVIHKGGNKFSGRKVSISGEDGLKGVLNMKNPGKPSLVLNHNKTPFHWITLKHTDIGTALRSIGSKLFDHELILESSNISKDEEYKFLAKELIKKISGKDSCIAVKEAEVSEDYDIDQFEEDASEETDSYQAEWGIDFYIQVDPDKLDPMWLDHFEGSPILTTEYDLLDAMGLTPELPDFRIQLSTSASVSHEYDGGDYYTPPSSDTSVHDYETEIYTDQILVEFAEHDLDLSEDSDVKDDASTIERIIVGKDPNEIYDAMCAMVGLGKNADSQKKFILSELDYLDRRKDLTRRGIKAVDRSKWTNINMEYANRIEPMATEYLNEYIDLQNRDTPNSEDPLTDSDINRANEILKWFSENIPVLYGGTFIYTSRRWVDSEKDRKIPTIAKNNIETSIKYLKQKLSNPDSFIVSLEKELNDLLWKKKVKGRDPESFYRNYKHKIDYLNIFLNPDIKI